MFSTLSHIFISLHCNHCWSFKHALNIIPSKNLTYFNKTPIIQHKASILKNFMPCLLTLFGQNSTTLSPLSTRTSSRKPRLQPCPNSEAAPAGAGDADADADDVKSPCAAVEPLPPTLHRCWLLRRKPQRKPQQCPPKNRRRRSKGRPDQGLIETCLTCIAVIRCTCLQYSAIGQAELQQRIQPQGSITWSRLNRKD